MCLNLADDIAFFFLHTYVPFVPFKLIIFTHSAHVHSSIYGYHTVGESIAHMISLKCIEKVCFRVVLLVQPAMLLVQMVVLLVQPIMLIIFLVQPVTYVTDSTTMLLVQPATVYASGLTSYSS